ncbi:hypothetical protein H0H92_002187 [Tricholoma furcatifolium]|nr:hypothetical protein H0H92_002187 [Tricholoma furcatifolium]
MSAFLSPEEIKKRLLRNWNKDSIVDFMHLPPGTVDTELELKPKEHVTRSLDAVYLPVDAWFSVAAMQYMKQKRNGLVDGTLDAEKTKPKITPTASFEDSEIEEIEAPWITRPLNKPFTNSASTRSSESIPKPTSKSTSLKNWLRNASPPAASSVRSLESRKRKAERRIRFSDEVFPEAKKAKMQVIQIDSPESSVPSFMASTTPSNLSTDPATHLRPTNLGPACRKLEFTPSPVSSPVAKDQPKSLSRSLTAHAQQGGLLPSLMPRNSVGTSLVTYPWEIRFNSDDDLVDELIDEPVRDVDLGKKGKAKKSRRRKKQASQRT